MLGKVLLAICAAFFAAGCAGNIDNLQWARDQHVPIVGMAVPTDSWPHLKEFLYTKTASPDVITVLDIPPLYWERVAGLFSFSASHISWDGQDFVMVRHPCFFHAPSIIYREEGADCLNHEVGHVREYLEGVPPHSKYAR